MGGKNLQRPKQGRAAAKNPAVMAVLLAFGCGVGACMVLLALGAFLLTHTGLPLAAVRPMACMAAAIGAAVSARVLAGRLKQKLLLCGLGCGAFYTVCLMAATLAASGELDWQGANAMLPMALPSAAMCARDLVINSRRAAEARSSPASISFSIQAKV